MRVRLAWAHVLEFEVSHRPTFEGLGDVDVVATQQGLRHFGTADQVYLRCHLDGTLFVQNGRAKFQPGTDDKCPWCGSKDGFEHRAWICPYFESTRSHFTSLQRQELASLPRCFSVHGWALVLPEWESLVDSLQRDDGFQRMSPVGLPTVRCNEWCDLFVDGTCSHPKEPQLRYGAWAVTWAVTGPGCLDNRVVIRGHLRGLCQSAFRAELSAVFHAIQWASERCLRVRLWCDCQGVVQGVRKLLKGGKVHINRAHSDLWQQVAAVLHESDLEVQIFKVVSHCVVTEATSPIEEWVYWHNMLTDQAAAAISERRQPEFWEAWRSLATALTARRNLHMAVLQMLLQQSRLATVVQKPEVVAVPQPFACSLRLPQAPAAWVLPEQLFKRYGRENVEAVHRWWHECGTNALSGREELRKISGIQLFLDFRWTTDHDGPYLYK